MLSALMVDTQQVQEIMICKGNNKVIRHKVVSKNAPTLDSRFISFYFLELKL
jgi:hypothetical protein